MTEYLSAAETAKVVRKLLKTAFPGIKFSVRSETYSMGSSVRVSWTDGPTTGQVDHVVGFLAGSEFDGMIDLKINVTHWLLPDGSFTCARSSGTVGSGGVIEGYNYPKPHPDAIEVNFADSISTSRKFSPEFLEKARAVISAKLPGEVPAITEYGYRFQDYEQENLYWRDLTHSVLDSSGQIINTGEVA